MSQSVLNSVRPVQTQTAPRLAWPLSSRSGLASCQGQRPQILRFWRCPHHACWCRRYWRYTPCLLRPACWRNRNLFRNLLDCHTLRAVRNSFSFTHPTVIPSSRYWAVGGL